MRRPAINCRDRRSPSRPGPDGCHCGHPSRPSQISMNAIERGGCVIARHGFRILLALLFSTAAAVEAAPRPTVVELYTSEGCSSCPPAEEYLGELTNRNDVLPLSFHVDYWDELGWRDPLALSASTGRQRGYAARLGLRPSTHFPKMQRTLRCWRSAQVKARSSEPPGSIFQLTLHLK